MARVKRGVIARARHKKILKQAKGYYGARSRVYRVAFQAVIKAGQYAYRDRRQRKRQFPSTVDCAYQRSSTSERYFLQQIHQWPEKSLC
ncbi:50S ribosomal protein L20 [Escherichia coli]|uniref:50S ribosomal protein L20 n=1 Tax=Escherichia coli TaxID=562 RepID=A0A376S996_ECOLX|nr:50S ribosomal protein L20 [Escherichia coli]